MSYRSTTSLCHNLLVSHILIYNFARNKNIAINRLANVIELQTMYHLIANIKVPEQHVMLCQLADIMASVCGVPLGVNIFSNSTRLGDILFFLKDTQSSMRKCSRHANLLVRLFCRVK